MAFGPPTYSSLSTPSRPTSRSVELCIRKDDLGNGVILHHHHKVDRWTKIQDEELKPYIASRHTPKDHFGKDKRLMKLKDGDLAREIENISEPQEEDTAAEETVEDLEKSAEKEEPPSPPKPNQFFASPEHGARRGQVLAVESDAGGEVAGTVHVTERVRVVEDVTIVDLAEKEQWHDN